MTERRGVDLAPLTTLRLGGRAARVVEATSGAEIVDAVGSADQRGEPVLLLGGGSNLVVSDAGWPGVVVLLRSRGVDVAADEAGVRVRVAAGESWDDLVARSVAEGWSGLECLSGVPGLAGATPIQNVSAYGQEVAEVIRSVRVFDRHTGTVRSLSGAECGFAYRTSLFKHDDRYAVLDVTFRLDRGADSAPIRYSELGRALGVEPGRRVPLTAARAAVLDLRRGKGMLCDEDGSADPDTRSAGSFFTNPVLDATELAGFADRLAAGVNPPRWPVHDGRTKLSAAWLIEHAGFHRGYRRGRVGVSTKHTLALTNRGGASTAELLGLAREIRTGVRDRFGVTLRPEPSLVGVSLD